MNSQKYAVIILLCHQHKICGESRKSWGAEWFNCL